ncbi:MAG: hypothetical protein M3P22_01570 [bacterium]|nr:hypothetical protein [bacterium]
MYSDLENKIKIGILRGGNTEHYSTSIKQGGDLMLFIMDNLSHKFTPVDIFVDKDGIWHTKGIPLYLADLSHKVDVIWNTTHNSFAQMLYNFNIPVFNGGSHSSFYDNNQNILREHIKNTGGMMPKSILFPAYQLDFDGSIDSFVQKKAQEVFNKFGAPWVIKTYTKDSGVGIHIAHTYPKLIEALFDLVSHSHTSILVEELILGKATSVHSLQGYRGEEFYNFPLLETSHNQISLPHIFSTEEKNKLFIYTKELHKNLNDQNYMKIDYVIGSNGKIYITDVAFHPDIRENSHLAQSILSVGSKIHNVFEHIVENTLK